MSPPVWEAWIETMIGNAPSNTLASRLPFGRRGLKLKKKEAVVSPWLVASRLGGVD